ncbi:GtrA family protein [Streptococcus caprae]|uniref:GtrA family protein n=1 Tax=Streptococcus caprae TaxID=1640501 RepID=A0ABV8CSG5_9STRE
MKKYLSKEFMFTVLNHEIFKYLVAGVLSTIVYTVIRINIYPILQNATISAIIANVLAIIFAFIINDTYVFAQKAMGRAERFIKFFLARLSTLVLDFGLAWLLVDTFPGIIGQFVHNDMNWVNAIATLIGQVLIMVTNYFISKLFIFKHKK